MALVYEMIAFYEPKKIAEDTPIITMWVVIFIKLLMVQTKRVTKLIAQQNSEEALIMLSTDVESIETYKTQITTLNIMTMSLTFWTFGSAVAMIIVNSINRNKIETYNVEHNATLEKPWLYNSWFPFNKNEHPFVAQGINIYSIFIAWSTNTVAQALILGLMLFVKGQLLILQKHLRTVNWDEKASCFTDDKICFIKVVRELAIKHQEIIKYVNDLNGAIKHLMLLEFVFNCLNAAAICVMIIAVEPNWFLAYPIFYFGLLVLQIFLLGWTANEIEVQSVAIADAIYQSKWYEQSAEAKKMLLIMMIKAQVPLHILNGPFGAMTTQTSLATMKAAYSYVSIMIKYYNNN